MIVAVLHVRSRALVSLKRKGIEIIYEQEGNPEPDKRLETVIQVLVICDGAES